MIHQKKGSEYYYYHYNHKGDVEALTEGDEELAAYYGYDAWGNTMTEAEKSGVDNRSEGSRRRREYSTKEWDEESGLYYFGVRYYSPETGRWTQRDPAGTLDGLNLYVYVVNSPTSMLDEWGAATKVPGFRKYERCPVCGAYKPRGGRCPNRNCPSNRPKPPSPPQPPAPQPAPQQPAKPQKPCPKKEDFKPDIPVACWLFLNNPERTKCIDCCEEIFSKPDPLGLTKTFEVCAGWCNDEQWKNVNDRIYRKWRRDKDE